MDDSQFQDSKAEKQSISEVQKVKVIKADPIDDVSFDGEYEQTASEEGSEEEESEEEFSYKRSKSKSKKQKKVPPKVDKPHIIMNVSDTKYPVVKFVGKKIYKWELQNDPNSTTWDIWWTDNAVQPETLGRMSGINTQKNNKKAHQKINHFPGMYSLARKNRLGKNLMKMRKQFPDDYKFFPQTWLLPAEYGDFRSQFQKGKTRTFIIKPEASCQGRGIFLTRSIDSVNPTDHYVAQRYMHKPCLIDGFKFDLRIYVLLAGCEPMRIYLYNEGLVRLATEYYVPPTNQNLEDMCMHLTNYAINKDNPNFVFNEDKNRMDIGHKRSVSSVFEQFKKEGHNIEKLWNDIGSIAIKTFSAAQPILSQHFRSCQPDNFANNMCFEVLGFDIFLDSKLKPYLLEVNHTPSFTTDTPLDSHIKKSLIRDTLRLMNINIKSKYETMSSRRELMQQRVLTGKKLKLTPEEKKELYTKAQQDRDVYENQYLGGFKKIYPLEDTLVLYERFLQYAQKIYEDWTGANIRRNVKKEPVKELPKAPPKPKPRSKQDPIRKLPLIKKQIVEQNDSLRVVGEDHEESEDNLMYDESPYRVMQQKQLIKKDLGETYGSRQQLEERVKTLHKKIIFPQFQKHVNLDEQEMIFQEKGKYKKTKQLQYGRQVAPQMINNFGNFVMPKLFDMHITQLDASKKDLLKQKHIVLPTQVYPLLAYEQKQFNFLYKK